MPPYYETRLYVARIVRDFNKKKAAQMAAAQLARLLPPKRTTTKTAKAAGKAKSPPLVQAKVCVYSTQQRIRRSRQLSFVKSAFPSPQRRRLDVPLVVACYRCLRLRPLKTLAWAEAAGRLRRDQTTL